jgi:predicted enzyme related to lactoylglutathione lyase
MPVIQRRLRSSGNRQLNLARSSGKERPQAEIWDFRPKDSNRIARTILERFSQMSNVIEGRVSFLEIGSGDVLATRKFFGEVFDWPCHDDAWLQAPDIKVGTHGDDPVPQIYVYFNVADLPAAIARVKAAGGEASDPTAEPGFGNFSNCRAPGGAAFGLHTKPE